MGRFFQAPLHAVSCFEYRDPFLFLTSSLPMSDSPSGRAEQNTDNIDSLSREIIRCLGQCQTVANGVPFEDKYCKSKSPTSRWRGENPIGLGTQSKPDRDLQEKARMDLFLSLRPQGCSEIIQASFECCCQMSASTPYAYGQHGSTLSLVCHTNSCRQLPWIKCGSTSSSSTRILPGSWVFCRWLP